MGRRHGSLDDKAANVLPALLEQRDKVVDGQHEVGNELVLGEVDVADGDTETQHLLELEHDGRANLSELGAEVLGVRHGGGELARLGEAGSEQTGDLLDEGLGGEEGVVLLGELFDELLVLVEPVGCLCQGCIPGGR